MVMPALFWVRQMENREGMKIRVTQWLGLLATLFWSPFLVAGEVGRPVDYVIGISPFLDRSVKDDVYRRIVEFMLEEIPANSSLGLYDAYELQTIARLEIPSARAFQSGKTRANQFREQIYSLKEFLATPHAKPAKATLDLSSAIRFPQFMDFVGEHLAKSNHTLVVVLLGSPLYLDHKEPSFSMVDGYFPSDGHLLAGREQSVFGLKEREGALRGIVVNLGWFGDPWVSEVHQEKIARFWSLYLKGQGAELGAFCSDLTTLFNSARGQGGELRKAKYEIDPEQKKIEMLRISRDIGVADWITRDSLPRTHLGPPTSTIGPMKIGIRWQGNIDLDLYAKPKPQAETLYFEHTRSPQGYYFKDHRSSPDREYEFIEFESPVDVWQVEAMINFYAGSVPEGPIGEVRIEFEGKIYTGKFSIASGRGNKGRSGQAQAGCWTQIDIPKILKLEPQRETASRAR